MELFQQLPAAVQLRKSTLWQVFKVAVPAL
jgi:hypothetical protein